LLRLSEACERLGIYPNTLRKWDKQVKIRVVRTIGGRRRILESEVERLTGVVKPDVSRKTVIYCRVSFYEQKGDLERQSLLEYAKSRGYEVASVLEDVARGLNEDREPLNRLFDMVEKHERSYSGLRIGSRFGFKYLEGYFSSYGVRMVNGEEPKEAYRELVED